MAGISILRSDELFKLIAKKNIKKPTEMLYVIASTEISRSAPSYGGKTTETLVAEKLIPTSKLVKNLLNKENLKDFKKGYKKQLEDPEIKTLIYYLISLIVEGKRDIVIVTTPTEFAMEWYKVLKDYIESEYDLKVALYKDIKKSFKKSFTISKADNKKIKVILKKKKKQLKKDKIDVQAVLS